MDENLKKNNYLDIFIELVRTDFVMRYHNSVLGFVWVILKPLLIFLVIYLVFSLIFTSHEPYYQLNLLLGILLYSYFSEATIRGVISLHEKANIILKVNFPKIIVIFASIANSLISLFCYLLVFLIFYIFVRPPATLLGLPYFLLNLFILTLLISGLNFFLSIVYIKLKDLSSIWEVLLQIIFYTTPIIYPLTFIPQSLRPYALINPLAVIINQSRSALIGSSTHSWPLVLYTLTLSLIIFISGFWFFQKNIQKIAEDF